MAAARTGKVTFPDGRILRTTKTRHPRGFMQGRYLESQRDVEAADKPFEFFMNRFRLLEAAPRVEFIAYTGLCEDVIRPQLDRGDCPGLSHRMCGLLADNGTW
ncbi:putative oxygen-independent coproporphyrinogen III oxidase [Escherichia coli]|uniref:Putative oxygen-independent coproporphyrinogen III oxidase n=1 Tax=Escherichia coli TaxID=562 RepID=A0A376TT80_ECOLX|nr:putative oxygen-independent coproporphyrinogen III oxidase [Escherichia coli]